MFRMARIASAVLFAVIFAAAPQAYAQAGRPMAINDLLGAVRISDPQLSPDGKRVLFTRTTTAVDSGKRNTDVWIVPSDGSASAREFLGGEKSENTPRFTPDGRRVAFISSRDGASQVYVSDADGRNVKPVTRLSGGVQPPLVVSRDSRKVAFVSDVYPQCKDEA